MDSSRRRFVGLCLAAPVLASDGTLTSAQRSAASTTWPSVFPALRQSVHGRPLTYLDSAATTLRPQSVIDALVRSYSLDNANPSRVHTLASRAADHLAAARETVARFINAADASEIVFVRGTTEGVNLVASAWGPTTLSSGDEIVISIAEHSSNLMPWTRLARERGATLRVVDVTDEGRLEPQAVEKALSTRSRIVALTHVSNVLGAVNPIKEICAQAHAAGARVVVDGGGRSSVRADRNRTAACMSCSRITTTFGVLGFACVVGSRRWRLQRPACWSASATSPAWAASRASGAWTASAASPASAASACEAPSAASASRPETRGQVLVT